MGLPWLERRTLLEIIEKLLWSASGWWKGDSCGVLSSNSTRLEPLDQTNSPLGLYHDGSHRRRQRANRRGVWVFGKKSWFQRLPSHLQRFWHLHHGILQDDLITSTFLLLLCGCLFYFLFFFYLCNRCLVVVIVKFAWSEVLNREVFVVVQYVTIISQYHVGIEFHVVYRRAFKEANDISHKFEINVCIPLGLYISCISRKNHNIFVYFTLSNYVFLILIFGDGL